MQETNSFKIKVLEANNLLSGWEEKDYQSSTRSTGLIIKC